MKLLGKVEEIWEEWNWEKKKKKLKWRDKSKRATVKKSELGAKEKINIDNKSNWRSQLQNRYYNQKRLVKLTTMTETKGNI